MFSQVILTDSIPSYQKNFNKAVQFIDSNKFDKALSILKAVIKEKKDFGIEFFGLTDKRQGIVHVIGPEQGFTQPGMTIVCGDSHTSSHLH